MKVSNSERTTYRWTWTLMLATGSTPAELEEDARTRVAVLTSTPVEKLRVTHVYNIYEIPAADVSRNQMSTEAAQAREQAGPDDTLWARIHVGEPATAEVSDDTVTRLAEAFCTMLRDGTLGLRWMNEAGIGPKPEGVTLEQHVERWLRS